MKLNLNGVEIELPNNAKVDVSKDGKSVKIELPEAEVDEKIRLVEVPGEERVVERIRVVEVEKYLPCTLPHYPQTWPNNNPWITYTTSGTQIQNPNTVTYGSTTGGFQSGSSTITCGTSNVSCNNPNLLTNYDPATGFISTN